MTPLPHDQGLLLRAIKSEYMRAIVGIRKELRLTSQKHRIPPVKLSITHISCMRLAPVESSVILSLTPNRGGVADEQGHGNHRSRLA